MRRPFVELISQLHHATNLQHGCYTLAGELQAYLPCRQVALGLTHRNGRCRLKALSGVAHFDRRSSLSQALESAMDEALLRHDLTCWPTAVDQHGALAHKTLCSELDAGVVLTLPLYGEENKRVGAITVSLVDPSHLGIAARLPAAGRTLAGVCIGRGPKAGGRTSRARRASAESSLQRSQRTDRDCGLPDSVGVDVPSRSLTACGVTVALNLRLDDSSQRHLRARWKSHSSNPVKW